MGADLRLKEVDNDEYLSDPLDVMSRIGEVPSIDVTKLRDDDDIPDYVKDPLYAAYISPNEALLIADSLEKHTQHRDVQDSAYYTTVIGWLRHMGSEGFTIVGMH